MCGYIHMQVPTETRGIRSPVAGTVDSCEQLDLGAGNQSRVIWKDNECP